MERSKFLALLEKWRLYFDEGRRDVFDTSFEESEKCLKVVPKDSKIYVPIFNMVPLKVSQDLTLPNPDSPRSEQNDVGATTCAAEASGLLIVGHKEEQQLQMLRAPQDLDSETGGTSGKGAQLEVEPMLDNNFISNLQIKPVTKVKQILDRILIESLDSAIKEAETALALNQFVQYMLKFTQLLAPILEELKEPVQPELLQDNFAQYKSKFSKQLEPILAELEEPVQPELAQYKSMFDQHLKPIIEELEELVQPELPQNQFAQYKTKFAQHLEIIIEDLEKLVQPELEQYWQLITQQSCSEDSCSSMVQRESEISHFEDEEADSVAHGEYAVEGASPVRSKPGCTVECDISDNDDSYEVITMFTFISFGLLCLWILYHSLINNKQDFHTNPSLHNKASVEEIDVTDT